MSWGQMVHLHELSEVYKGSLYFCFLFKLLVKLHRGASLLNIWHDFFFFFYHPVHLSWDKSGCFKDKPLVASLYTDCNSIKKTHCQRITNKINFETERITLWPTQFSLHLIHKGMVRGCWQNPALIPPPPTPPSHLMFKHSNFFTDNQVHCTLSNKFLFSHNELSAKKLFSKVIFWFSKHYDYSSSWLNQF